MKTMDRLPSRATLLAGLYLCMFAAHAQNGPFLYAPTGQNQYENAAKSRSPGAVNAGLTTWERTT